MIRKGALLKRGEPGFSLVEIIVVVAIMAVLGTVLVPQLMRYVNQNRATACQVDREGILAVYERCVHEETKQLKQDDLEDVMDGTDLATQNEIQQFERCPLGGTYTAKVVNDLAIIECSCDGHEEVVVDFAIWDEAEGLEDIDEPFAEPPAPSVPEPDEPTTEEPSSTEELTPDGSYWPYEDDIRWQDNMFSGRKAVKIAAPAMFTSREGTTYVIPDLHNTGEFEVLFEWNKGPEYVDTDRGEDVISVSGRVVNDVETILHPTNKNAITGINYGDILIYKGYKYIYGSHDTSAEKNFPVEGQNGNNFFLIGPAD